MSIKTRTLATEPANLQALWALEDTSGTDALDETANSYDGSYVGSPSLASLAGPDGVNVATFDGSNDQVNLDSSGVAAAFDSATGTALIWFKVSAAGIWTDGTVRRLWSLSVNGDNVIRIERHTTNNAIIFRYIAGATSRSVTATGLSSTDWICAALTWDTGADEIEAFIDGVSAGTGTSLGTWAGTPVTIRLGSNGSGQYWSGGMALAAIWDTVLTDVHILNIISGADPVVPPDDPGIDPDTVTRTVYFDWDRDGTFTDMSASVISVSGTIGRTDWKNRVADVGIVTIELSNEDRHFSPENTASPYYGQMVPNIPVRVEVSDSTGTYRLFTVWTTDFDPQPGQYGDLRCTVTCMDRIGQLQDADMVLPLQVGETSGAVMRKVLSAAYTSGQATGTVYMRQVADAETLSIGDQHYTFKNTLTAAANEIALGSQDYFFNPVSGGSGVTDAAVNAAAAINRDSGPDVHYSDATERHRTVTALGYMGIGWPESNQDTDLLLRETTDDFEALACSFSFAFNEAVSEPTTLPFRRVYLYLKKVGSPTGTLTLRHETPTGFGGSPSGSVYNVFGEVTMNEADLPTSYAWVAFDWPTAYDMESYSWPGVSNLHWLVLSTDRAASAVNYVAWGRDSAVAAVRFSQDTKTGGAWTGRVVLEAPLMFIPGLLDLTATQHGAWGNSIELSAETTEFHVDGDPTINTGSIISGDYTDTEVEDHTFLVLAETTGTPAFDYEFESTISGTGLTLGIFGRYDGNSTHTVNVDAYNGATWDTLGTIPASTTDGFHTFTLAAGHTIGGVVTFRIQHTTAGNPNHELYLDHVFIISDTPSGIATMELSGLTLTGGVDGPTGQVDVDAGKLTLDYAGDTWVSGETNALSAASDVTYSEFGLLWAAKDGTLVFRDQEFEFEQTNADPTMICADGHSGQVGRLSKDDIINRATISYQPRALLASGVIAKANKPYFITGVTGTPRAQWNAYEGTGGDTSSTTTPGQRTVVLPYVTDETGDRVGAFDLEQPLVAGTDYELWGTKDKTGPEVTDLELIKFSLAMLGSGVQVHMRNTVNRWGWVHELQVRGVALYKQNTTQLIRQDDTSRATYGLRAYEYTIPFPSADVENMAFVLAWHFINRYKNPRYILQSISVRGERIINGTSIWDLDIGDVIDLSETQTLVSNFKLLIIGMDILLPENDVHEITYYVDRLNSDTYWQLGVTGFSELGVTTLLSI